MLTDKLRNTMPKTFAANLALANEIFSTLKPQIISSHDVVDRTKLPFMYSDRLKSYEQEFGTLLYSQFQRYQKILDTLRKSTEAAANPYFAPMATACIATTYFGAGECIEVTNRAMLELLKKGYADFSFIVVEGNLPTYFHAFIIVGNCKNIKKGTTIDDFELTNKEAVYLDIFLGRVGRVADLKEDLRAYFETYELKHVSDVTDYTKEHVDIATQLETNAIAVHAVVAKKMLNKKFTFDLSWNGPYYAYHLQHSKTQGEKGLQFFSSPKNISLNADDGFFKPRSLLVAECEALKLPSDGDILTAGVFAPKLRS
jgi:hypothetical protein